MGFIKCRRAARWAAAGASRWTGEALTYGAEDSHTGEPRAGGWSAPRIGALSAVFPPSPRLAACELGMGWCDPGPSGS